MPPIQLIAQTAQFRHWHFPSENVLEEARIAAHERALAAVHRERVEEDVRACVCLCAPARVSVSLRCLRIYPCPCLYADAHACATLRYALFARSRIASPFARQRASHHSRQTAKTLPCLPSRRRA